MVTVRTSSWLRSIFSQQMQQAIFTWGFRAAAVRGLSHPATALVGTDPQRWIDDYAAPQRLLLQPDWAQGLALLRRLKFAGIPINTATVRRAFYNRMWILFGPGTSKLAINESMRRLNQLSLAEYIYGANRVCEGTFIKLPHPSLLTDTTPNEALLKFVFFGRYRRAGRGEKVMEWVDVGAWTSALLKGQTTVYRPLRTGQRLQAWRRCPYRRELARLPHHERKATEASSTALVA